MLDHARAVLSAEAQRDTLVTLFDFPPALSTACEQYLLYFVQFLRDLGIEAEGDVRHRANQVLFSVRPHEGAEALDRIREALAIYLQLPSTPGLEVAVGDSPDIAVLQLQANIHHLKGQITLLKAVASANRAEIRALDAENQALSLANYQYHQVFAAAAEANRLVSLPQSGSESTAEDEPILGGMVTLTRLEGKGFKVNLPEIFRKLKRGITGPGHD
ncbi:MAG: hypothetical protein KY444_01615 [Gemmatimonadetes bacterium]|nr:hypothetical protein [Gemmatimonadota bacterium]